MSKLASIGLWVALAILCVIGLIAGRTTTAQIEMIRRVEHTHEVIDSLERLEERFYEAENARRGYALTGDDAPYAAHAVAVAELTEAMGQVRRLISDPEQQRRLDRLEPLLARRITTMAEAVAIRRADGFSAEREARAARNAASATAEVRPLIAELIDNERSVLRAREQAMNESGNASRITHIAGTLLSVGIIVLAFASIQRENRLRARSEQALRESEEHLSTTLLSIGDGVIATDRDGRVVHMNRIAETLTGWRLDEARGRPFAEVFRIVDEAKRAPVSDPIAQAIAQGVTIALANHTMLIAKDGSERPVADSAAPIRDGSGQLTGAVLVFRDQSTERAAQAAVERANNFLSSIVENIPNMIFVKDAKELRFERLNRAGEELLGLSRTDLLGKNDFDFFPKEEAEFFQAKDRETLAQKVIVDIAEEPIQTKKGIRWLHTKKVPIVDETGTPTYLLGISEDITERRRVEDALRVAREDLESFSYSVAHDLRAPLRSIDGFSQALVEDAGARLDDVSRGHLDRIRAAAARMGQLIDDLLALSRVTRRELHRSRVDVTALVAAVVADLQNSSPTRHPEVVIQGGVTADADPNLLRIVLENLLGNAWKFTTRTPTPRIEFGVLPTDKEPREFFVRDNGAGFDMAHADKLFGVFQRLHSPREFEGTGIGLATVQRIIHRHGGAIRAEAKVDGGATFFFSLDGAGGSR